MDSSLLIEALEEKTPEDQPKPTFEPPEKYEFDESGKLVIAEDVAEGQVGMSACVFLPRLLSLCRGHVSDAWPVTVRLFLTSFGGAGFWALFLGGVSLAVALSVWQTWFLGVWTEQYQDLPHAEVSVLL